MTKRQKAILTAYKNATATDLAQVYQTASVYKWRAQKRIIDEMNACGGWGYRILGANCMQFSCAYLKQNSEHGQIEIVYHTAQNKRVFDYVA